MVANINKEDIIRYWRFLAHKSQTEIRAIKPRWVEGEKFPKSVFISNAKQLVEEIEKINGEYNIYVGINERVDGGKEDNDVSFITNIGHDIDAHGSGEEGLLVAGQVAMKMKDTCAEVGYKEPLVINSGHGYWVIHHIKPISNTEENAKKVKEFGMKIKKRYEVSPIEIDSAVYNPSRIARVPGTINISEKDNPALGMIMNNPSGEEDEKLTEDILKIEIPTYQTNPLSTAGQQNSICSFMDYCLTHEIPKGERHRVISRNMAIYIAKHPDRELLKQQYSKIQKGSDGELDNWLRGIDEKGIDSFPFSIGELVNFTKKYKIPFDWKTTPEYQLWIKSKRAEDNLRKEIEKEQTAETFEKAIKFFIDKRDLAKQFLKVQPVYFDSARNWWVWNNEELRWVRTDETDILNLIDNVSMADTISSKEKNEIIESLKQEGRKVKPKKIKSTWIQFKDVIYDILTGERFKATPEYFVTNPLPYKLSDDDFEITPNMDRIFGQWVGEENIKTLYEIIAYCMVPDYPINRIFCFVGGGMNGKSKYLELLRKFIGDYNCCSTELDLLIQSRFEVTRLHKKLVCQMGETNFNELSNTSILKKLSGGDLIPFEYKRADLFEDINYAKILISTNNLPETTDKTIGFYRRWMIVDFPNTFSEKKDILAEIPEEEYENLAVKCTGILRDLLSCRAFTNEGSIEDRQKRYEDRSNPFDKFFKEFISDGEGYITKWEFEKRLNEWCKANRFREIGEVTINKKMKEKGIFDGRERIQWWENQETKEKQVRVWKNIKWK